MKKYLLLLICAPLLFSCGSSNSKIKTNSNSSIQQEKEDLIAQFNRDLKLNIEASNNKNWDVVLDMTYPHLFNLVSREEMIGVMKSIFDIFKDFQVSSISNVRHSYPIIDHEGDQFTKFDYDREATFTFYNTDDMDNILPGFIEEFGEENIKVFRNTNSATVSVESSMLAVLEENASEWKYLEWNDNIQQFVSASVIDQLSK